MLVAKKELDYYYPDQIDIEEEKVRRVKSKKKRKSKVVTKASVISIAIIGLILCLYILYGYTRITSMRLGITELEKKRIGLEREREDLIAELEGIKSSSKIEEEAVTKLGMDYPVEDQVVYLDVKDLDAENRNVGTDEIVIIKQLKNIASLVLSLF